MIQNHGIPSSQLDFLAFVSLTTLEDLEPLQKLSLFYLYSCSSRYSILWVCLLLIQLLIHQLLTLTSLSSFNYRWFSFLLDEFFILYFLFLSFVPKYCFDSVLSALQGLAAIPFGYVRLFFSFI